MTDDSTAAARDHGPPPEESEPTAPIVRQSGRGHPGETPAAPYGPHYGPFHGGAPLDRSEDDWTTTPISAAPVSGADPTSGVGPLSDPYGFGPAPARGPRIEPSPPPDHSGLIRGLVAGLLAGLVVFGAAGWFVGRATSADPAPARQRPATGANPTPSALGVYEQSQLALNQPTFPDGLGTISRGWLPYLSGCSRSGTKDGPALNPGEKVRVRCTLGGMSAIFVEYQDIAGRDKARVKVLGQNVDARSLAPGVAATAERATPSGRTTGNYAEYAYKIVEQGRTRTVSGLWWDDAQTPTAAYLLAYWTEGVGESWAPMRDIWTRYA